MDYNDIYEEIVLFLDEQGVRASRIESISLPEDKHEVYRKATVGQGYPFTFWEIPITLNEESDLIIVNMKS